ncbi:MAG: hypothetical protein AB1634_12870, partial [Thermodesulfobacteriota bacterium]
MTGRRSFLSTGILLLAVLWPLALAWAAGQRGVAVLASGPERAYRAPVERFTDGLAGRPVAVFDLEGDVRTAPEVMERLLASRPALILALGAKAATVAKTWTSTRPGMPVVFAMVLDWQRYNLLADQSNICGIATEAAMGTQLANILLFKPEARRAGLVVSRTFSGEAMA